MDNKYIKLADKEESQVVKWIHSGCSKDQARPILTGIHIKNGQTYSADGFKLMRINTPESLTEFEGMTIKPLTNIPAAPAVIEWEVIDGHFPDCEQIIATDKEEVFSFSVNKKLLADAIEKMPGDVMITFSFTGSVEPMRITNGDALLVVMPMKAR